jgi:hypothetical protein
MKHYFFDVLPFQRYDLKKDKNAMPTLKKGYRILEKIYERSKVSCLKKRKVLNNSKKSIQNLIITKAKAILSGM